MKPVHIEFVAPRAWKLVWLSTALIVLLMMGAGGWRAWQQHEEGSALQKELVRLQAELQAGSAPAPANPREASERAARHLLQRDWNRVFDAVEDARLASARLRQLNVDARTGEVHLEFEVDSFVHGASLAQPPGGGVNAEAWQLERLGSAANQTTPSDQKVRGIWRTRID